MLWKMTQDRLLPEWLALVLLIVLSAADGSSVPDPLHPRQLPVHRIEELLVRRPEVALVKVRQRQVGVRQRIQEMGAIPVTPARKHLPRTSLGRVLLQQDQVIPPHPFAL